MQRIRFEISTTMILPELFLTLVSKTLSRDAFLQSATQFNLNTVVSMGSIIHQQEVGVVVIQAGEIALSLYVHQIMGWKTTLKMEEERKESWTRLCNAMQVINRITTSNLRA